MTSVKKYLPGVPHLVRLPICAYRKDPVLACRRLSNAEIIVSQERTVKSNKGGSYSKGALNESDSTSKSTNSLIVL